VKQLLLIPFLFLFSFTSQSQNKKYVLQMKKNIQLLDSAKAEPEYLAAVIGFEKLAAQDKKDWLPNYYAGLAYTLLAYEKEGEDVDKMADKAETHIRIADSLSKNNAEIYVLKAMCASARIMVDPMSRGFMYGKQAYDFTQTAMTLEPGNPRPYANKGQGTYYTPEAFGGGPAKAKPFLEKAIERYKTFKPKSEIHPNWGMNICEDLLKKCAAEQ
jgi:hypothetical protein